MGWFLPTRTSKQKPKKPAARSAQVRSWDPARTLATLRIVAWCLFLGLLGAGWVLGERYLRPQVAEARATMPRVELLDLPPWMQQWLVDDLRRTIAAAVDPNPFEQLSLQEVAAELQFNPWVRSVDRVSRKPDGVIEIAAAYRRPAALVQTDAGYQLVDDEAICLPANYGDHDAMKLNLPILVGVASPPPPPEGAGEPWPGGDVQAGLALARLIRTQPWREQVKAIDVTNHDGRDDPAGPFMSLLTARGMVRWGRTPDAEGHYEPPANTKLIHIARVAHDNRGRIDAGGRIVDVFGDVPFVHNPLPESPVRAAER